MKSKYGLLFTLSVMITSNCLLAQMNLNKVLVTWYPVTSFILKQDETIALELAKAEINPNDVIWPQAQDEPKEILLSNHQLFLEHNAPAQLKFSFQKEARAEGGGRFIITAAKEGIITAAKEGLKVEEFQNVPDMVLHNNSLVTSPPSLLQIGVDDKVELFFGLDELINDKVYKFGIDYTDNKNVEIQIDASNVKFIITPR